MKSYKNFRCYYAILAVLITGFYLSSCKKTEPLTSNGTESSHSMEEKFFGNHRSNDPTEVAFVEFLKRVNEKENFVEKTVMQIGYPRWDKTFIKPKNLPNLQQSLTGDSTEHYYIPFVRDSQNFVNAAMIITATPTDTSFSYRVDCDYRLQANSTTSVYDDAEYMAIFFMFMDKRVFGYHKFSIIDSNLFKENGNKATKIELTAAAANPTNGNLWDYVEFCQNVNISLTNCPRDPGQCSGTGGSCDNCPEYCTTIISYTYCWWDWVGTGGGGSGGTTTTGGGGSSGSTTPPSSCQGGGGTIPIPTDGGTTITYDDDPIIFLTNTLGLSSSQVSFLVQNPSYQGPIYNYISQNYSIQSVQICKDHIDLLISEPEYVLFVNNHNSTGNHSVVWWMDDNWLDNPNNFNLDITRADNQYDELTAAEKALVKKYPSQAYAIKQNINSAFTMSNERMGSTGGLNDKKDAFRHAFFNAINTRDVGKDPLTLESIAKLFSDAHETEVPSQLQKEKDMDLWNNAIGHLIGDVLFPIFTTNSSLADDVYDKLINGELRYIHPLNFTSSPSYDANNDGVQDCPTCLNGILSTSILTPTNQ